MSLSLCANASSGNAAASSKTPSGSRAPLIMSLLDLIPEEPRPADQRQSNAEVAEEVGRLQSKRMRMPSCRALLAWQLASRPELGRQQARRRDVADDAVFLQLEAGAHEPDHEANDGDA